jgi:hypothetical protein
MANGELDWQDAFVVAKQLGADDTGIQAALSHTIEEEYGNFFNANYDFYKILEQLKEDNPRATAQDAVNVRTEFINNYVPSEASNYDTIGAYLKSYEGKQWLVSKATDKLDFYNQPVSPEVNLRRKWGFTKTLAFYSNLPVVISYDPPEHLQSRTMDDVGIIEVAVAPVEFSKNPPYRDEEGKGKYTYQIGEQEWRFFDVTDLWPVRIIE